MAHLAHPLGTHYESSGDCTANFMRTTAHFPACLQQRDQQQVITSQSLYTNNKSISWKSISFKFWASTVSTATSLWSLYIMLGYVSQQVYSTWCSKVVG